MRSKPWSALLIAALAIGAGAGTYLVRSGEEVSYSAVTRFAAVPSDAIRQGPQADLVESVHALDRPIVTATASELLQSGMVAEAAGQTAGIRSDELDRYDFTATQVPGSAVLRLVVTGPVPDTAAALAQATRDGANTLLAGYVGAFEIQSIDRSTVRAERVGPNAEADALAVGAAVIIAGFALLLLLHGRRDVRAEAAPTEQTVAGPVGDPVSLAASVAVLQSMLRVNGSPHVREPDRS